MFTHGHCRKGIIVQSTSVSGQSPELGPPNLNPPPPSECVSPLDPKGKGEQQSLPCEGVGGPNSDDWTESLALCKLCGHYLELFVSMFEL